MIWLPVALAGLALLWFLLRPGSRAVRHDGGHSYDRSGDSYLDSGSSSSTAIPFTDNSGYASDSGSGNSSCDTGGGYDSGGWDSGGSCDSGGGDSGGGDSGGGGGGGD